MIQGPCGNVNGWRRDVDRNCSKKNPSESVRTHIPQDSQIAEDIQIGGRSFVNNKGFKVDNSWVVPYNPFLLLQYNAHINIEVVHSVQAVKYLYKYINKRPDIIIATVDPGMNMEERNELVLKTCEQSMELSIFLSR